MKIKEKASIAGLKPEMRIALREADSIYKSHDKELVITCGLNGEHSAGSLHYSGYAIDIRTHYFTTEELENVYESLVRRLGLFYDVVLESTHIHIEWRSLC